MDPKKVKGGDAAFRAAAQMPDVRVTLTAAEVCGVSQLAATFAKLGMLYDPFANMTGEQIFNRAQSIVQDSGVETDDRNTGDILDEVERLGLPDVELELSVVGLTTMCGIMKPLAPAMMAIGGPVRSGWEKLLKVAIRLADEIRERSEVEHLLEVMRPKHGVA